jgi:alkanesulfonate monooxygenase SsuD/methylene tetrahydromethanopterin reductase-like flavin-dependent oxidoreductase (luciferase family)
MRFCLSVPPFTDPAEVVSLAVRAEASGWDGFFLWDHLRWDDAVEAHDPWVLLGAIAQETSTIRLGTMVTPLSRRRPQVVAKHLTTLDHLSGGRVTFGVGLGDPPDLDFSDFGDEPSYATRAAITDEALAVLAGLVGKGRVSHHGAHIDADASVRPLPLQRPRIPIWVAGRARNARPLARAKAWDGYVPIANPSLSPGDLSSYVGPHPHDDWDLVAQWAPGFTAEEFAAAGATWLVRSVWPSEEGWVDRLRDMVAAAPGAPTPQAG